MIIFQYFSSAPRIYFSNYYSVELLKQQTSTDLLSFWSASSGPMSQECDRNKEGRGTEGEGGQPGGLEDEGDVKGIGYDEDASSDGSVEGEGEGDVGCGDTSCPLPRLHHFEEERKEKEREKEKEKEKEEEEVVCGEAACPIPSRFPVISPSFSSSSSPVSHALSSSLSCTQLMVAFRMCFLPISYC
jgi:hypothetical protein